MIESTHHALLAGSIIARTKRPDAFCLAVALTAIVRCAHRLPVGSPARQALAEAAAPVNSALDVLLD